MVLPLASTIGNIYKTGSLNPQWNANGGSFGLETVTLLPFVTVSNTPSFFGAASYNMAGDSFSAKIGVAPAIVTTGRTSILIKKDEVNYAELFVGGNRLLSFTVVSDDIPDLSNINFPTYDPVAHAFWRITDTDNRTLTFWVSADGTTWNSLASIPHNWDARAITIMFMAGYTGNNSSPLQRAYISNVNSTSPALTLSSTVRAIDGIGSLPLVSGNNQLSGNTLGASGTKSKFTLIGGLPQGGLTDFAVGIIDDPLRVRYTVRADPTITGGANFTWARTSIGAAVTTNYRDGSYWPTVHSLYGHVGIQNISDSIPQAFTNVQVEETPGYANRLSLTASYYTDSCEYAPQKVNTTTTTSGSTFVTRSTDIAQAGSYSGKMVFGGTPVVDGLGNNAYWPYPTRNAITPVLAAAGSIENMRGTVSLSTQRAGTQWYAALVFYDANFNLTNDSTFIQSVNPPTIHTHPGGGIWQQASTDIPSSVISSATVRYIGVVPVVITASSTPETVYMSGHSIQGLGGGVAELPTTYSNPREINISLKADRVNLVSNSGFPSTVDGWTTVNSGVTLVPDASDSFSRTVANGWGTANIGGAWTTAGGVAADYSVNGSKGVHSLPATASSRKTTLVTTVANQDIRGSIATSALATGNSILGSFVGRSVDDNNEYIAQLEFTTTQTIILTIRKRVTSVETQLATFTTNLTHVANTDYAVRFYITGTTLSAKVWMASATEPANFNLVVTDSSLSAAANIGCRSILNTGNTNVTPTVLYDNFSLNNSPISRGWDGTTGFNSLGSMQVSFVPPSGGSTGTAGSTLSAASRLLNITSTQFPVISGLQIGSTYTVSAYVKQSLNCPDITMRLLDANFQQVISTDINTTKTSNPNSTVNGWTRLTGTFTIPPNGLPDYRITFEVLFTDIQTNSPFNFWVDSILLEKGSLVNDYFDGSFGSADYQYEKQNGPDTRSYYYKDFANKLARINKIVPEYTPVGSTVNILSAQTP